MPRINPAMAREIDQFVRTCRTASLCTADDLGRPHAVNLWYATDERGRMYFVSSLDSAHSRHVIRDPHVALTIYGHTDDPLHVHGVQMHGLCTPIAPPPQGKSADWKLAWEVYLKKFPFVACCEMFRQAVEEQCFFRITPTWLRWMDNRKGFGFQVEQTLVQSNHTPVAKAAGKGKPRRTPRAQKTKRAARSAARMTKSE